ncbi:MAG: hypothetical protein O7E52_06785 [Candidatus Poribacteria bacterium]|nr:hypothetical protein [Candidatus Poribacteria bacterium]
MPVGIDEGLKHDSSVHQLLTGQAPELPLEPYLLKRFDATEAGQA